MLERAQMAGLDHLVDHSRAGPVPDTICFAEDAEGERFVAADRGELDRIAEMQAEDRLCTEFLNPDNPLCIGAPLDGKRVAAKLTGDYWQFGNTRGLCVTITAAGGDLLYGYKMHTFGDAKRKVQLWILDGLDLEQYTAVAQAELDRAAPLCDPE